jgi:NADH-quinone oxidoreductase subunit J
LSLLGTAALFLCQGAQFLGVATVVVYAGAILVTFLFVLMLANPSGQAHYDRMSWEALLSAGAGALLVGILTAVLAGPIGDAPGVAVIEPADLPPVVGEADVLDERHMAALGAQLFGKHLVAIEVAGTLLLVALVGAVAITAHGKAAQAEATRRGTEGPLHG